MSLSYRLHRFADDDLVEAWEWYEAQQHGLGDRFLATVHVAITRIADLPNSGSPVLGDDSTVTERRVGPGASLT
jgi:hypothetical protein